METRPPYRTGVRGLSLHAGGPASGLL